MKIIRLYTDEKGESHFEDVEIQFQEPTKSGRVSARLPATGIIFREVPADYDLDWHPAPRRQYIINLDAGVQLTASDGETRRVKAGEVIALGRDGIAVACGEGVLCLQVVQPEGGKAMDGWAYAQGRRMATGERLS